MSRQYLRALKGITKRKTEYEPRRGRKARRGQDSRLAAGGGECGPGGGKLHPGESQPGEPPVDMAPGAHPFDGLLADITALGVTDRVGELQFREYILFAVVDVAG